MRFREHVLEEGLFEEDDVIVVALSGGADSLVLLHLLAFTPGLPGLRLHAAHFDHRMREGSAGDALWVRGVAAAWEVPSHVGAADEELATEEEARKARYGFLDGVRSRIGARWVVTAHHADDQAETVLFRILRGTGIRGLGGIPDRRSPGVLRPLLPFRRAELESYAEASGIAHRPDPTNSDTRFARNLLRSEILPGVEETIAPAATRALLGLSARAREDEAGWESLLPSLIDAVSPGAGAAREARRSPDEGFVILREALLGYHPEVRARVLRELAGRMNAALTEEGTRNLVRFTSSGGSGRRMELPNGVVFWREFDAFRLFRPRPSLPDDPLSLPGLDAGEGTFRVGGRVFLARWALGSAAGGRWSEAFAASRLNFPLRFRGWMPGDRIRGAAGTKKLKKLYREIGLPLSARGRQPLLADRGGEVLWIPGLARSRAAVPEGDREPFIIDVSEEESDRTTPEEIRGSEDAR